MEPENIYLSLDEAKTLWAELDQFRYGAINGNSLQRWLEFEAGFNMPMTDTHFLYEAFKSFEWDHRITESQWIVALAGPQPEEEEPEHVVEEEGPQEEEKPVVKNNGSSLRKKKQPVPEAEKTESAEKPATEQKNIR